MTRLTEAADDLLVRLAGTHGTPLYVIYEDRLRAAYQGFLRAFEERWPKTTVAYSYKTNRLLAVCRVFHSLGAWAEVTSDLEVYAAEQLGVQPSHVIFNGPHKTDGELEHAVRSGYCVNVDGWHELERLSSLCQRTGSCRVGLRVNSGNRQTPHWDKFGFSIETGDASEAALRIVQDQNLRLVGLHSHIGTNVPDAEPFVANATALGTMGVEIESQCRIRLEFVDLGGGFATPRPTPYFEDAWAPASIEEYAEAIAAGLKDAHVRPDVQLILEPGRVLAANAVALLTRVVEVKKSPTRGVAAIVDTGVSQVPSASFMKHTVRQLAVSEGDLVEVDLFGDSCMQADLLGVGIRLHNPTPGDILVIGDVGAYNQGMSHPFIRTRPPSVMVRANGLVEEVRRREVPEDVFALESA